MAQTLPAEKKRRLPILQGVLPIAPGSLGPGIIAGATLAALAIPEVMGYTKIAGMPVVTGLYTILIPIAVFALLGSSRHLVVGADSASAAIMAAGLVGLAAAGSPQYVALAEMLAILTGLFLLIARIIKLGFLADFLSRTVLVGFLTGVGIQVAFGQIAGMLGVTKTGRGPIAQALNAIKDIPQANTATVIVSASVLIVIVGARFINKKIPGALIAVVGSIWASYALNLAQYGVTTLGTVPGGLPTFGFPNVPLNQIPLLVGTAASLFLIVLAQSAATSRAYAAKYSDAFDENIDLIGLSLANVSAGLSGTFVCNGSPTKTEMVDSAGGRSQVSQLTTSVIVLIVLLFLTKPLAYMPNAVLSSVVFLIGIELVDIKGMRSILRVAPAEFWVALLTAVTVIGVGVEQGIILAIVLSIVIHLSHSYRPFNGLLVLGGDGHWHNRPVDSNSQIAPGVVVYRFGASLYYANASRFDEEVRAIVANAQPKLTTLIVAAEAMGGIDYTGAATLKALYKDLCDQSVRILFAEMPKNVRDDFSKLGLTELLGNEALHRSLRDAVEAANPEFTASVKASLSEIPDEEEGA